uniref:Uncharacterized protein n=1 Tax=Anguilla anguilla TaxID=7936 RepID=A0A0E9VAC5_ANGAN
MAPLLSAPCVPHTILCKHTFWLCNISAPLTLCHLLHEALYYTL